MVKGQPVFDIFPVWFSYASEDFELLQRLHRKMQFSEVLPSIEKALSFYTENKRKRYLDIRLELVSDTADFAVDIKSGDDLRHRMAPTDSIDGLSRDIGNCIFKVMLISPAYFTKQACLEELYLSLCSHARKENTFPMLILTGFAQPKSVFSDKHQFFKYPDKAPFSSRNSDQSQGLVECTLQEALLNVHRHFCDVDDASLWREFDFSEKFIKSLPSLLNTWSKMVFETVEEDPKKVAGVYFNNSKSDKATENLIAQIYRYGYRFLERVAHDDSYDLQKLYEQWLETRKNCPLTAFINTNCVYEEVTSLDAAMDFIKQVIKGIKNNKISALEVDIARASQLCCILIIKAINSFSLPLKKLFHHKSIPIQIFVNDETKLDFYSSQHAAITFSVCRGYIPRGIEETEPAKLRKSLYPGAVTTKALTSRPDSKANIEILFENLVYQLFPTKPEISIVIDEFNDDLKDEIRVRLRHMDEESQCFILLPHNEFSDPSGHFKILEEMEDILNKGFPDKVTIPAVITRNYRVEKTMTDNSTRRVGVDKMDIFLSGEASTYLYTMVHDITAAIQSGRRG